MRSLRFPVALWNQEPILAFPATREVIAVLGLPGFIETDAFATHGGREYFWAFEQAGLRLCVEWHENYEQARVAADPPDSEGIVTFLNQLGIYAEFTALAPQQPPVITESRVAIGAVWVLVEDDASSPTAVFTTKQRADAWIRDARASGELTVYPLNRSRRQENERWLRDHVTELPGDHNQIERVGEAYGYEAGEPFDEGTRWRVWRQDDNGISTIVDTFERRREAVALLSQLEAKIHKQTYWLERTTT